jgi:hypothetical protein
LKQGDFHSNRFSSYRGFAWVDLDFRTFWFDRPVSRMNSPVRSVGELKKLLPPVLRKRKYAGAKLDFPLGAREFLRMLSCIYFETITFAQDSTETLRLLSY